jgi:hypothetical protein
VCRHIVERGRDREREGEGELEAELILNRTGIKCTWVRGFATSEFGSTGTLPLKRSLELDFFDSSLVSDKLTALLSFG